MPRRTLQSLLWELEKHRKSQKETLFEVRRHNADLSNHVKYSGSHIRQLKQLTKEIIANHERLLKAVDTVFLPDKQEELHITRPRNY